MARPKRFGSGERIPAKTTRDTSSATPTYSYDANGNRTNPGDTVGTDNQISTDGTWTYTYDKEGNVTEKTDAAGDKWQYTYDNMNELVGATYTSTGTTVASTICTYVYDVFGDKIEQEETVSGVTTITKFAYDGSNIWAAMSSSNALQTRYVYMDGSTTPVAQMSGTTVSWYDTDYEGSVRVVTNNSTGAAVDTITYDAYGNIRSESSPVAGDYAKYTGGLWDSVLQLYSFDSEFYNPVNGSRLQQDPLFPYSGVNPYEYGDDDPSNETDPTGLDPSFPQAAAPAQQSRANDEYFQYLAQQLRGQGLQQGITDRNKLTWYILDGLAQQAAARNNPLDPSLSRLIHIAFDAIPLFAQGNCPTLKAYTAEDARREAAEQWKKGNDALTLEYAQWWTETGPLPLIPGGPGGAGGPGASARPRRGGGRGPGVRPVPEPAGRIPPAEPAGGRARDAGGRFANEGDVSRFSRDNQYPHDYRANLQAEVIRRNTNAQGQIIDPATGKVIPPDQVTIEHITPVVEHWNTEGRFQTRQQRNDWYNNLNNLTVKPKSANSAEGAARQAQPGGLFIQQTGGGYTPD